VKVKKDTSKHSCTYFSVTIHKMNALNGDTFSATPRIPCHLLVKKLEGSLLCWTPILSQMNPINTLPPNCQKIHSNLILASVPRSSEWSLPSTCRLSTFTIFLPSAKCYKILRNVVNWKKISPLTSAFTLLSQVLTTLFLRITLGGIPEQFKRHYKN
jgi:hypothetical protein